MICEFFLLFFFCLVNIFWMSLLPLSKTMLRSCYIPWNMHTCTMYHAFHHYTVLSVPTVMRIFLKKKKNISLFLIPFTFDRDVYTIRDINNNMLFMFLTVILPVYVSAFESYSTMSTEMNFSVKWKLHYRIYIPGDIWKNWKE